MVVTFEVSLSPERCLAAFKTAAEKRRSKPAELLAEQCGQRGFDVTVDPTSSIATAYIPRMLMAAKGGAFEISMELEQVEAAQRVKLSAHRGGRALLRHFESAIHQAS